MLSELWWIVANYGEIKPLLLINKDTHLYITTHHKFNSLVESRANPIMTLYAYNLLAKYEYLLIENPRITKKLYIDLCLKGHGQCEKCHGFAINRRHSFDLLEHGLLCKCSYDINFISGVSFQTTIDYPQYNWCFEDMAISGKLTTQEFVDNKCIQEETDIIYYEVTFDFVKTYKHMFEDDVKNISNYIDIENIEDIVAEFNLDIVDVLSYNNNTTMQYAIKYDPKNIHSRGWFSCLSNVENVVKDMIVELLLEYPWDLEELVKYIDYNLVLQTPQLEWNYFLVNEYTKMPFNVFMEVKDKYDFSIQTYSRNPGLRWIDVVENLDLNWCYLSIISNEAFN